MDEPTKTTPKKREEFGPRKRAIFLDNLRKYGAVYFACKQAHIARSTAYDARNAEPEFAAAWEEAKEDGLDLLEATAHKRAHSASDTLLIFLLKAGRPGKYRETVRNEVTGKDGGPMEHAQIVFYIPDNGRDAALSPAAEEAGT